MTQPTHEDVIAFIRAQDPHTVLHALGVEMTRMDQAESVVEVEVSERLFQHAGIVHGGIYVLLMESAASIAAALSVDLGRFRVAGQEISASHVRATTSGRLVGRARPLHQGRTAIIYACEVHNDGKLVSTGRCTIAVRPHQG
jgi:1,4-dihydroxy-2-naphthoyl-CoA hydrolase